jgi:glycylpeptide N-tetradecanoyltransferase
MEEIIDTTQDQDKQEDASDSDDHSQDDLNEPANASTASSTSQKKKKKKKSKAARALNALRGKSHGEIPQELVDKVLDKVKAEGGETATTADHASVRMALDQMNIMDVVKGRAGIGGLNRKDMGEHKVRVHFAPEPGYLCRIQCGSNIGIVGYW